jgi:drug/metabolite transporter (DMT)-like permease
MTTPFIASGIVLLTGVFWGVYWVPVRMLADLGLDGAWGTGAIALAAMLFLLPSLWGRARVFADTGAVGVLSVALGGAAFALYSIGFLYGKVALVVLLWFFSPVWSVLIARYVLGWQVPRLRLVAIAVGLVGLFIMLGGDGALPVPRSLGEWMAFVGGLIWGGGNRRHASEIKAAAPDCGLGLCSRRGGHVLCLCALSGTPAQRRTG